MSDVHSRLKLARESRGYVSARQAAQAMGVLPETYAQHENGLRGVSRAVDRYAKFFRVSLDWLMIGKGEMVPRRSSRKIPVEGLVGAGASVEMIGDSVSIEPVDSIDLPDEGEMSALIIRGDSQYPRFLDGEVILFDPRPVLPQTLIGRYAVVQTMDGRRLIKTLRRGAKNDRWRLESHNAPPEDNVELLGAWRYLGVILP